jgi:hypothetical protein
MTQSRATSCCPQRCALVLSCTMRSRPQDGRTCVAAPPHKSSRVYVRSDASTLCLYLPALRPHSTRPPVEFSVVHCTTISVFLPVMVSRPCRGMLVRLTAMAWLFATRWGESKPLKKKPMHKSVRWFSNKNLQAHVPG